MNARIFVVAAFLMLPATLIAQAGTVDGPMTERRTTILANRAKRSSSFASVTSSESAMAMTTTVTETWMEARLTHGSASAVLPNGFQQASSWYQGADGTWYWVHRNFSNNQLQVRVYIYDPVRNKLKVFDENDDLIFFGDPGDFWGW